MTRPAQTRPSASTGGRPPKFDEPSRPITLTLPNSTLDGLEQIDEDRGRAIVKLTSAALRQGRAKQPLVEIVRVAKNTGLIIVGPSKVLGRIPFLHLVEVAPARFLLALDPGNDFQSLEIAIHDLLEQTPENSTRERAVLEQLLAHIRKLRKGALMTMAEILFVRLDDKGGR